MGFVRAGLCYPYCASGFTGVGPVCWGGCPGDYANCGTYCAKRRSGKSDAALCAEVLGGGFVGAMTRQCSAVSAQAASIKKTMSIGSGKQNTTQLALQAIMQLATQQTKANIKAGLLYKFPPNAVPALSPATGHKNITN